jgi:hypothetical protein
MKKIRVALSLALLIPILGGLATGQEISGEGTSATDKDRDKAEGNTSAFDPSVIYSMEGRHIVVFFDIDDGNLVLSSRPAQVVRGNLPYKPQTGNFRVIARGDDGKEITSYLTSDIREVRVFEGEDRETTRIRDVKDLMVRIPFDPRITQLTLRSTVREEDERTYDIEGVVARLFRKEE